LAELVIPTKVLFLVMYMQSHCFIDCILLHLTPIIGFSATCTTSGTRNCVSVRWPARGGSDRQLECNESSAEQTVGSYFQLRSCSADVSDVDLARQAGKRSTRSIECKGTNE